MSATRLTLVVAILSLGAGADVARAQRSPALLGVGTTTWLALDSTRHGADTTTPRPIQITVWYPAARAAGAHVTYGEYFDLTVAERGPASDSAIASARAGYRSFAVEHGLADSVFTQWLAAPMSATRDAAPLKARRPLVVIVNGNGQSAQDQSTLAEYLAGRGFVVATMPSYTRISRPPESEADIATGAEEQADDMHSWFRACARGATSMRRSSVSSRTGSTRHA